MAARTWNLAPPFTLHTNIIQWVDQLDWLYNENNLTKFYDLGVIWKMKDDSLWFVYTAFPASPACHGMTNFSNRGVPWDFARFWPFCKVLSSLLTVYQGTQNGTLRSTTVPWRAVGDGLLCHGYSKTHFDTVAELVNRSRPWQNVTQLARTLWCRVMQMFDVPLRSAAGFTPSY